MVAWGVAVGVFFLVGALEVRGVSGCFLAVMVVVVALASVVRTFSLLRVTKSMGAVLVVR